MSLLPSTATAFAAYGDDLAPSFSILVSDTSQAVWGALEPLVEGVTFEDDEEMSSLIELTVANQPATSAGQPVDWRAVLDSKAFAEGNWLDLWMGYGSRLTYMDRGEIVRWLPRFEESGPGTLTIKAYDGRHRMAVSNQLRVKPAKSGHGGKRTVSFAGQSDDAVVRAVAAKYGYGADVDTPTDAAKTRASRVQPADMSDWAFLQRIAEAQGHDLWVDYSAVQRRWLVHFKRRTDAATAGYRMEYGQGDGALLSVEVEFDLSEKPSTVEVLYWDRKTRKVERLSAGQSTGAEAVQLTGGSSSTAQRPVGEGAKVRFSAFGHTYEAISDRPFASQGAAAKFALARLREREAELLTLTAKTIGLPDLRARQIHEIVGLSKRIDGLYRLQNVKHSMRPGQSYGCEIQARKVVAL